ncbi:MlaD family protein [Lutimonas sp.]|uniref:MlaD family protein n=1 Tax=Lutimonas sp. TaxID=1872403 RepID=UPI003D9B1D5A
MKVTSSQKLRLGLFVLVTGIILVVSLYVIGKKQNLFGDTFEITAVFTNVKGLKIGNNVRYAGINIGTVQDIVMLNDSTICVGLVIEEGIRKHMKKNVYAIIGSDGLVGSMVVNILPSDSKGIGLQTGDTIRSVGQRSTTDMMSTLSNTNDNVAALSEELLKISLRINEGKGTLGLLLNDEAMAQDLKETMLHVNHASKEASVTISEIKQLVQTASQENNVLNVFLKDSVAAEQVRAVISNLEASSKNVNTVIQNLNELILKVKEGEGTFNYLVTDTTLVRDINETVKNLKEGSILLNENLEALKHNTFFKGYFKKQEKARRKEEKKLEQ